MFHFLATHMQDSLHGFHDSCKNPAKNLQVQWQDSWQVFARLFDRGERERGREGEGEREGAVIILLFTGF